VSILYDGRLSWIEDSHRVLKFVDIVVYSRDILGSVYVQTVRNTYGADLVISLMLGSDAAFCRP